MIQLDALAPYIGKALSHVIRARCLAAADAPKPLSGRTHSSADVSFSQRRATPSHAQALTKERAHISRHLISSTRQMTFAKSQQLNKDDSERRRTLLCCCTQRRTELINKLGQTVGLPSVKRRLKTSIMNTGFRKNVGIISGVWTRGVSGSIADERAAAPGLGGVDAGWRDDRARGGRADEGLLRAG